MNKIRISVEYFFGDIVKYSKFYDFHKNLKIQLIVVGRMYTVCVSFQNACSRFYGSITSVYFNLNPPNVQPYFQQAHYKQQPIIFIDINIKYTYFCIIFLNLISLDFLKVFFINGVHVDAPILYFKNNDSNFNITINQYYLACLEQIRSKKCGHNPLYVEVVSQGN